MQGVPQGAQRGNRRARWAARPLPAPTLCSSPSRGSCRLSCWNGAESSQPQPVLCVGRQAEAGGLGAELWPGLLGSQAGGLDPQCPTTSPPTQWSRPCGEPPGASPLRAALPGRSAAPRFADMRLGGWREVQGCSQHWAAPAWRWELAPCWPVERDISSNATKGLPDLHSPARTPFLHPSGLFITVLTGKRPCQPSPGPALRLSWQPG